MFFLLDFISGRGNNKRLTSAVTKSTELKNKNKSKNKVVKNLNKPMVPLPESSEVSKKFRRLIVIYSGFY
jgi:hypothetical protein